MIPAEPLKPDINARLSSQLAMYSLYKLIRNSHKIININWCAAPTSSEETAQ